MKNKLFAWQLIMAIILSLNIFFLHNQYLGLILGTFFILLNALVLGKKHFKSHLNHQTKLEFYQHQLITFLLGLGILMGIISLFGAIAYYLFNLNNYIMALMIFGLVVFNRNYSKEYYLPAKNENTQIFPFKPLLITLYAVLSLSCWYLLITNQTAEPLASTWHALPSVIFVLFFLASLILVYAMTKQQSQSLIWLIGHFILFFSVALVIYKLGFGFDPFVHQATEKHIFEFGQILPKPFYYLGQYSLVVFLAKILNASPGMIDRILLPLSAGCLIPTLSYYTYQQLSQAKIIQKAGSNFTLIPLILLTIPFWPFINTTPHGLAVLFSILTILSSLLYVFKVWRSLKITLLFGLASLAIHPLIGLPTVLFCFYIFFYRKNFKRWKIFTGLFALICLPLMFVLNSWLSVNKIAFNSISWNNWQWPQFLFSVRHYQLILDMVYAYGFNAKFIILMISAAGAYLLFKQEKLKQFNVYLTFFLILLANYLVVNYFINFNTLIDYEQNIFAQRILDQALWFLIPFYLYAWIRLKHDTWRLNKIYQAFYIILLTTIISYSFYLTYPRFDNYEANHGYNVSIYDFQAAEYLKIIQQQEPYIVLSSQNTSAAALALSGFDPDKYYQGNFYYPVPTSGQLYQYYLQMVNNGPSREIINQVRDLTGVQDIYFVLPNYWADSYKLIDLAEKQADFYTNIDEKIYIFKYHD